MTDISDNNFFFFKQGGSGSRQLGLNLRKSLVRQKSPPGVQCAFCPITYFSSLPLSDSECHLLIQPPCFDSVAQAKGYFKNKLDQNVYFLKYATRLTQNNSLSMLQDDLFLFFKESNQMRASFSSGTASPERGDPEHREEDR